jgi:PQQ-dependent catabolism-associated CXXCW motif protein
VLRTALLACLLPAAVLAEAVPEPAGYREAPYRGPTPATLQGATVVTTAEAHALWEGGGVAFLDVLPREERPADLPDGTLWRDRPHESIPGATWLPNVGYAQLSPPETAYLAAGLEAATGGDPSRPVLFFCRAECWMSWNAARRAVEWGYGDVRWYPEGIDGWTEAGHPTETLAPMAPP